MQVTFFASESLVQTRFTAPRHLVRHYQRCSMCDMQRNKVLLALTHRGCHNLDLARLETKVFSCTSACVTKDSKRQGLIQNQPVLEPVLELENLVKRSNVTQVLRNAFHNNETAVETQPAVEVC